MGHRWYVVRTKPRSELLAANELRDDELEIFSPIVTSLSDQGRSTALPLFPGYIFVRFDMDSVGWPSFRYGQSVLGFLNFNGEVPSLPDEVIFELKQRCENLNQNGGIWKRYRPGDWVQLVSSTIQGIAEVVEDSKSANGPVKVLLQLFARSVPAQVSRHDIQPFDEPSNKHDRQPRRTRGGGRWIQGIGPRAVVTQ